jgi:hypothetical protein
VAETYDSEIDHGPDPDLLGCPVCTTKVHRVTRRSAMSYDTRTNLIRCPNHSCPFGDSKAYEWYEQLKRAYNNRETIKETCVVKGCEGTRVVRIGPFCPKCERLYLMGESR